MSVAVATGSDVQVNCDEVLARQASDRPSVSCLGAVSAEFYGRDSFWNLLVLLVATSVGFVRLLIKGGHKPEEIEQIAGVL
jgi:hypothetical protein